MTMDQVRARLYALAELHGIPELHLLAERTKRKFNGRLPRPVSETVTPEKNAAMRAYHAAFPDKALHQIARVFGVNQGRVSEALRGKRQ